MDDFRGNLEENKWWAISFVIILIALFVWLHWWAIPVLIVFLILGNWNVV